jgi:hypothetical protein
VKFVNRRVVAGALGALAPLVMLAPLASANTGSMCSNVVEPMRQCQIQDRGLFNEPAPVEYPVNLPGLLYATA